MMGSRCNLITIYKKLWTCTWITKYCSRLTTGFILAQYFPMILLIPRRINSVILVDCCTLHWSRVPSLVCIGLRGAQESFFNNHRIAFSQPYFAQARILQPRPSAYHISTRNTRRQRKKTKMNRNEKQTRKCTRAIECALIYSCTRALATMGTKPPPYS